MTVPRKVDRRLRSKNLRSVEDCGRRFFVRSKNLRPQSSNVIFVICSNVHTDGQDPDCSQLVQEAGLRFFVWHLANHSSPIGGSVKLTMSLLNIIIPVSSVATSSTLSTLRSSTWAVRMASQLDCSFNSQGGWFVCLFVC